MISFYEKYKKSIYSQNGEDGIIEECLSRIGGSLQPNMFGFFKAIEFGAIDGYNLSNTAHIGRLREWTRDLYDISPVRTTKAFVFSKPITPKNVNQIGDCNLLSIDIDGQDYAVWQAYNKFRPEIVIIEINSGISPDAEQVINDSEKGTSYRPMVDLGLKKGYFLLCHTGNLIFVINEYRNLFPEIEGDGLSNHDLYFNKSWL